MVVIFLYGVFFSHPRRALQAGWRSAWREFLTFFGLIAVGVWRGGATTALAMGDLDAILRRVPVPRRASFGRRGRCGPASRQVMRSELYISKSLSKNIGGRLRLGPLGRLFA